MSTAPLSIQLNGQTITLPIQTDLQAILDEYFPIEERYVVALNGMHVAADLYPTTFIKEGDVIDTFQAIVGG